MTNGACTVCLMTHALNRIDERLTLAGWSDEDQAKLAFFCEGWAARTDHDSEAVRLAVLPRQTGRRGGMNSNGDEVWAIYRERTLCTVMLRRSSQPDTNLRVNKVTRIA